jgi:hypothetical protein
MKTLLAFLISYPVSFGALLGAAIGFFQCRRLVKRLDRGDLQVPDITQSMPSIKGLIWFLKAMFT